MRLCICISGQVRGSLDNLRELKKSLDKLPDHVHTSIIFSVWENTGIKIEGALGPDQMHRLFEEPLASLMPRSYLGADFWQHFPQAYKKLSQLKGTSCRQQLSEIFPEAVIDTEEEVLDLSFHTLHDDVNSAKMLYKIWRCNEIKKKQENLSGRFDCVVRMRPELKLDITDTIVQESLGENEIFLPGAGSRTNHSNDNMAYGRSQALDIYCSLFARTFAGDWSGIHRELSKWLQSHGIQEKLPRSIQNHGIAKDKLLSFEDVKGDTPLIDCMGEALSEKDPVLAIEIIDQALLTDVHIQETISLLHLRCMILSASNNWTEALRSLMRAEPSLLSLRIVPNSEPNPLREKIISLCDKLNLKTAGQITAVLGEDAQVPLLSRNLQQMFADPKFLRALNTEDVEQAFQRNDLQGLIDIHKAEALPSEFAERYRDKALEIETTDMSLAHKLMVIAQKIRPFGPLINEKIKDYEIQLAKVSPLEDRKNPAEAACS